MIETLSKDERSIIVYCETCLVDGSGLLAGDRMNEADHTALKKFKALGLLDYGRIPSRCLRRDRVMLTHWVKFTDAAWALAHQLRRKRSEQIGPHGREVFAELAERNATTTSEGTV